MTRFLWKKLVFHFPQMHFLSVCAQITTDNPSWTTAFSCSSGLFCFYTQAFMATNLNLYVFNVKLIFDYYTWATIAFDPSWGSTSTCSEAIDLFTPLGLNECTGEAGDAAWRIKGGQTELKTNVTNPGNMHHAALCMLWPVKMLSHNVLFLSAQIHLHPGINLSHTR